VVSFSALIKAVGAVGGVDVYVDKTTYDDQFHRTWTKGWHHLTGTEGRVLLCGSGTDSAGVTTTG